MNRQCGSNCILVLAKLWLANIVMYGPYFFPISFNWLFEPLLYIFQLKGWRPKLMKQINLFKHSLVEYVHDEVCHFAFWYLIPCIWALLSYSVGCQKSIYSINKQHVHPTTPLYIIIGRGYVILFRPQNDPLWGGDALTFVLLSYHMTLNFNALNMLFFSNPQKIVWYAI